MSASWLETGQRLYVFRLLHQQISLTLSCKCDSPIYNARLTLYVVVPHSYMTFLATSLFSSSYEVRGCRCTKDGGKVFGRDCVSSPFRALTGSISSFRLSRNKFGTRRRKLFISKSPIFYVSFVTKIHKKNSVS